MELLLTVEQTAERLNLKPVTIQRQLKSGALRGIKRGRQWRVPESALLESSAIDINPNSTEAAKAILDGLRSIDRKARNASIVALSKADAAIRQMVEDAIADEIGQESAEDGDSFADWRAMDSEPFVDNDSSTKPGKAA